MKLPMLGTRQIEVANMRVLLTVSATLIVLGATSTQSYAASCKQLWQERNQFYADANYCFKTQRAIDRFGNSGNCRNSVRLSAYAQRRIAEIKRMERNQGCSED